MSADSVVPLVSIVIPTYNRVGTLVRALQSVFEQTFTDYEILVVDDGSRDGTADVLAEYGDALRVFRQANAGASAARNRGVQAARGRYVAFLDSDDEWLPEKLARQIAYLESHPEIDILACRAVGETDRNERSAWRRRSQFLAFLVAPFPQNMTRYVVRRECFETCGLFDTTLHGPEDWEFWLRLLQAGYRFEFLDAPLCKYYHSADAISRHVARMIAGEAEICRRFTTPLPRRQRYWYRSQMRARSWFSAALNLREAGQRYEAFRALAWSLAANPLAPRPLLRWRCLVRMLVPFSLRRKPKPAAARPSVRETARQAT